MAKFLVKQEADYVTGHLRYGHREAIIEGESKEDVLNKLKNEGYDDYLEFVLDDYELDDAEFSSNYDIVEVGE